MPQEVNTESAFPKKLTGDIKGVDNPSETDQKEEQAQVDFRVEAQTP